ncbi:MAG: hypothetical protein ACP5VN_09700 [Acidobacteriota bacterium]
MPKTISDSNDRVWTSKTRGNLRVLLKDMKESDLEVPWVAEHLVKELPTQPGGTLARRAVRVAAEWGPARLARRDPAKGS